MKQLNLRVFSIVNLVILVIDFSIEQEISRKEYGKRSVINMYVVCDPQNLPCGLSACRHGGTCYPMTESDGTKSFVCVCVHGFGGKTCADGK